MQAAAHLSAQQIIQAILSPALMISATGLLLLSLNNRYTNVTNRIRALNDEKRRKIKETEDRTDLDYIDAVRLTSVEKQIESLFHRSNLLRRSILFQLVGIAAYIVTSLILASNFILTSDFALGLPVATFVVGLCLSFFGVIFAILEISLTYKVMQLEVRAE